MRTVIIAAVILMGFMAIGTWADRYVWKECPSPGGGYTNWSIAATNIHDAVNIASVGETVWITNGAYALTNQISVADLKIVSVNGPAVTFVDGNNYTGKPVTNRCFFLNNANALLAGLTISNGYYGDGGGVLLTLGTLTNCVICANTATNTGGGILAGGGLVINCVVSNNVAYQGAGYYVTGGKLFSSTCTCNRATQSGGGVYIQNAGSYVSNCVISCNTSTGVSARAAGGVYNGNGLITDCIISGNVANGTSGNYGGGGLYIGGSGTNARLVIVNNTCIIGDGGGVWYRGGAGPLLNSVISYNTAAGNGGGIDFYPTAASGGLVQNCVFNNNSATGQGGGVKLSQTGNLRNCLVASNLCGSYGGGISAQSIGNYGGYVDSCTIVSNYSGASGGGFFFNGAGGITNCIIWRNKAASSGDNTYNFQATRSNEYFYCCSPDSSLMAPNQGNITNYPQFADTNAGNYRLTATSPCLNAGTNETWMNGATDLDGRPRIHTRYGPQVDMGAYEFITKGTIFRAH